MDPRDAMEPEQLDTLSHASSRSSFWPASKNARAAAMGSSQITSSSDEDVRCVARGGASARTGTRAASILAQQEERNALCDEFLDLCSIHGESHPGEPRLARTFLARIERGEVGSPTEPEKKPW